MLSKCANPSCPTTFRYLHEVKLYVIAPPASGTAAQYDMLKAARAARVCLAVLLLFSLFDDSNRRRIRYQSNSEPRSE
jgi:hypothetical protein